MDIKIEVEPGDLKRAFRLYLKSQDTQYSMQEEKQHWDLFWNLVKDHTDVFIRLTSSRIRAFGLKDDN